MKKLPLNQLVENSLTHSLYPIEKSIDRLCMSIELFGVLENIIVYQVDNGEAPTYQIISGNRRKKAAEMIGLTEVPCTVVEPVEITESLVRSHQEQRTKAPSDILKELLVLKEKFGLRQGVRPNTPEMFKAKQYKDAIISEVGKHTTDRLLAVHKVAMELSGNDEEQYCSILRKMDKSGNINGTLKNIQKQLKEKENRKITLGLDIVRHGSSVIYKKSSEFMTELDNESVQTIICSPPYFQMRDYKIGEDQLGQQKDVFDFSKKLARHFNDAKRALKPKGSLFVNLADRKKDGKLIPLVYSFTQEMINNGWIWVDNITWVKRNSQYTNTKSSMIVHENILHFVKSTQYQYSLDWMAASSKLDDGMLVSKGNRNLRIRSAFDFRHPFLTTNTPNNNWLKKACESNGIHLTHSATFPREIPIMAILSTSSEGDLIVDMFNGSGTTAQAVEEIGEGRRYVGYELNETYLAISKCRLENYPKSDSEFSKIAA
jgi:DNA modification methylase